MYSITDEFHQLFVFGRSGRIKDLGFDFLGIWGGLWFIQFFKEDYFLKKKERETNQPFSFLVKLLSLFFFLISLLVFSFFVKREVEWNNYLKEQLEQQQEKQFLLEDNFQQETKVDFEKSQEIDADNSPVENKKSGDIDKNDNLEKEIVSTNEPSLISQYPSKVFLDIPFASQAPMGIWDELHEEACEEASLVMIYFFSQQKELTAFQMEEEIQKLVQYQIKKYGDYNDSNMERLAEIGKDFYGLKELEVFYDIKKSDLKDILAKKWSIIAPTAGRKLKNPYYTSPGPLYHNLVLKGFEDNWIITNDPGTKKGENFRYDLDLLYEAIFDFPGNKEQIEQGKKNVLVFKWSY